MSNFISIGQNEVWKIEKGFYFSYNANPGGGIGIFSADEGSDETAMVIGGLFYILNGDFREQYQEAFKQGGKQACVDYYNSMQEKFGSSWTTEKGAIAK